MSDGGCSPLPGLPLVDADLPEANSTFVTDLKTGHCPPRAPLQRLEGPVLPRVTPQEGVFPPSSENSLLAGINRAKTLSPTGREGAKKRAKSYRRRPHKPRGEIPRIVLGKFSTKLTPFLSLSVS
jgi:hypothetical protein